MRQKTLFAGIVVLFLALMFTSGCKSGMTNDNGALLSSITVTPTRAVISPGMSQQFTAIGTYMDNTTLDVTGLVTWTTSDPNVATISNSGQATGVAEGAITVTASLAYVKSMVMLNVTAPITMISIYSAGIEIGMDTLYPGDQLSLAAIATYADDSTNDVTGIVTWNSSNPDVATVSTNGQVTAVSVGSSTISATAGGISNDMQLSVTLPTVLQSVSIIPANTSILVNADQWFFFYASYSDGSSHVWPGTVTWSSSNTDVATISDSGLATGFAEGTSVITASTGTLSTSATMSVNPVKTPPADAQWARADSPDASSSFTSDFAGVATDSDGSIYAAGWIGGTVSHDFGSSVTITGAYRGYNSALVKYDSSGAAQWARTAVTGTSDSVFYSVAVAPDGSVYAAGKITRSQTYDFGNGVTAAGGYDGMMKLSNRGNMYFIPGINIVLVKYDNTGTALWARTTEAAEASTYAMSVAAAPDGSVYIASSISGAGTFDFGDGVAITGPGAYSNAPIIIKYNSSGTPQWAQTIDGSGYSIVAVASAPDGSVYAAAQDASYSPLLIKLDSSGTKQWARTATSDIGSGSVYLGLAVDSDGSVYTAGYIYSATLLVKYDSSGNVQWSKTATGNSSVSSRFTSVAVKSDGSVYAAGFICGLGTVSFGDNITATSLDYFDRVLLMKYSNSGTALWAESEASTGKSDFYGLTTASDDSVYAAGSIQRSGQATSGDYDFGNGVTLTGATPGASLLVKYK
jgi:uncharacterized protein YjdB